MRSDLIKQSAIAVAMVVVSAVVLSLIWHVPYIFTVLGLSAWALVGHLVTADDDAKGGWSNPDGSLPFPWCALIVKGVIFVALCVVAIEFPVVRNLGGVS